MTDQTLVLLARGPGLESLLLPRPRPRLKLRLFPLLWPLRRGGGLDRDREGERESRRRRLTGERESADRGVGERDDERLRPRDGDLEAIASRCRFRLAGAGRDGGLAVGIRCFVDLQKAAVLVAAYAKSQ